jgi:hypothetical protein
MEMNHDKTVKPKKMESRRFFLRVKVLRLFFEQILNIHEIMSAVVRPRKRTTFGSSKVVFSVGMKKIGSRKMMASQRNSVTEMGEEAAAGEFAEEEVAADREALCLCLKNLDFGIKVYFSTSRDDVQGIVVKK